jgi:hypothetical protein
LASNRAGIERLIGSFVISGRTVFGTKGQPAGKDEVNMRIELESTHYQVILKVAKEITLSDIHSPEK